jgi:predicted  nucleic acid-binding Zn-ribbon protein
MHRAQAGKVLIPNSGRLAAASGGSAAHVVSAALAATLSMDLGRSTAVFPVNLGADESLLGAAAASAAPLLSSGVFPPASARLLKGDREPETLPPSSARGGRRFEASFTEGLASSARGALTTPRSGGAYSARGGPAVPPTQLYDSAAAQTGGFSAFVGGDVFLPVSATAAAAAAGPSAALRRTATARLSSGAAATGSLGGGAGAGVATVALGSGTFVDVDAAGHAVLLQRLRASDAERRALAQRCDALEVFRLRYQRSLEDQAGLARKLSHTQRTLSALLLQQQLRGIEGIATAQAAVRDLDDVITRAEAAAKMGAAVAAAAALSAPTSTALFHPEDPAAAMALVARAAPGEAVAVVAAATGGPPGIDAPLNAKTSVAASAARLARLQLLHQSAVSAVGLELSATTQAVGALEGECARLEREAAEMRARLDACEAATERAQTAAASARGELERAEKDAWEWKEKARALQSDLAMLWREHRSVAGRNEELAPVVGEFERTRETADALQTELAAERRGRIEARARVQTLETELARVTEDLAAARAAHADCGDLGAALAAEEATSERLGAENQHATQLVSQLQWQLAVAEEANGRVQDRAVRAERELAAFQVRLEELMLWKSRELAARARRFGVAERARAAVAQLDAVVGADFGPKRRVAIVRNVAEDGPAAECGLQKGDRIMTICDRTVKKKADVLLLLMTAKANSTLPLVVLRKSGKGKSRNKVKLSLSLRVGAHGYSLEQLAALVRISHFHEDDFHALRSLRLFKLEAEAPDQLSQGDEAASSAI